MNKNNTVRKYIIISLIVVLSVVFFVFVSCVCLRLIPIKRSFSSVYERDPFSEILVVESENLPEIMILGSESHPYHYEAVCGHSACYLYSDTKLSEGVDVIKKSRLIGIVMHSTDNFGIWMRYPVFVFEC